MLSMEFIFVFRILLLQKNVEINYNNIIFINFYSEHLEKHSKIEVAKFVLLWRWPAKSFAMIFCLCCYSTCGIHRQNRLLHFCSFYNSHNTPNHRQNKHHTYINKSLHTYTTTASLLTASSQPSEQKTVQGDPLSYLFYFNSEFNPFPLISGQRVMRVGETGPLR